jgi:hypothetical protein
MPNRLKDLTGKRFSRLLVVERDNRPEKKGTWWICRCDCGNTKSINGELLKRGKIKACGCLRGTCTPRKYKNSEGRPRLYKVWWHMINRCKNMRDISYPNYGGRGITVCGEWEDFDKFAEWALKTGYEDDKEIDRIRVNEGYSERNCRWVSRAENSKNKRNTVYLPLNGNPVSLCNLSEMAGISRKLLWQKIKRDGKTAEEILRCN